MSSCSLVTVHASLKNMVSRKTCLKFLVPESGGRTWRDKKIHDFHNFSNSGLKFYMRISECICNQMMKKKYRFFDPFTGETPLKSMWECETMKEASSLAEMRSAGDFADFSIVVHASFCEIIVCSFRYWSCVDQKRRNEFQIVRRHSDHSFSFSLQKWISLNFFFFCISR